MFDPQFHAKAVARLNQILTDPNGQKSFLGKMVASRKAPTKASLGVEVDALRPGSYFGQEGLLQKDEITSYSSVANEYTELLVIDRLIFKDVFLAYFEKDLYDKAFFLVNLDLFSNWTPHLLRQLALSVKEVHHGNSQCLYRQSMSVSHVLIIKSGSVKLSTGSNSKPTQELLDQIIPPKDYLADILAEASITTKRPFKNLSAGTSQLKLLSASPSFTNNTIHLRSRALLRHTVSAPLTRKQKISPKSSEVSNSIVSFRLQEPRPQTTCQVCCLGPGDMLNHIEMLCNINHSLFNAFSLSDVIIYAIDTYNFMQLLERKPMHSLHSLIHQTSERVKVWKGRHPSIQIFKPLSDILQQAEKRIPSGFYPRRSKLTAIHSPEKLAYLAVKHLGKSKGFLVDDEIPIMQVELVNDAGLISEALIRKQFFIRQLTSKSLDDSYVHVSKAHTSFDSPLPKTHNHYMCSSDNLEEISPVLRLDLSTDDEKEPVATISEEKLLLTSICPTGNQPTSQTNCKNMSHKYLIELEQQKPKTQRFQMTKKSKPPVNDQDLRFGYFILMLIYLQFLTLFSAIVYQSRIIALLETLLMKIWYVGISALLCKQPIHFFIIVLLPAER